MIKTHEDGYSLYQKLKSIYSHEIELICINSAFLEADIVKSRLAHAQSLAELFPDRVILKESEFHTPQEPYYELSLFCNSNELDLYQSQLNAFGLTIDLVHIND